MIRSRRLPALILAAVLVAAGARAGAGEAFKPFKLKTPEGRQVALADVLDRATLVVFFFPTCSYCNAAYPGIARVHAATQDRGLSIVWINILPEQARLIADWRTRHDYRGTVLLGGASARRDYRLTQTPTWYLLDAHGAPVWRHDGYSAGDEDELGRQVERVLSAGELP